MQSLMIYMSVYFCALFTIDFTCLRMSLHSFHVMLSCSVDLQCCGCCNVTTWKTYYFCCVRLSLMMYVLTASSVFL